MIKKIAALAGAGALLASAAVPAFARYHRPVNRITQEVVSTANTGLIVGNGAYVEKAGVEDIDVDGDNVVGRLSTGNAYSRALGVVINDTDVSACLTCGRTTSSREVNVVDQYVGSAADTGLVVGNTAVVTQAHADDVDVADDNTVGRLSTGVARSTAHGWTVNDTNLTIGWLFVR